MLISVMRIMEKFENKVLKILGLVVLRFKLRLLLVVLSLICLVLIFKLNKEYLKN